jgi:hypothetical protein
MGIVAFALLGSIFLGCGSDSLLLAAEPYRSEEGGFVIRFPEGWVYREFHGEVRFGENDEAIEQDLPVSPRVTAQILPLPEGTKEKDSQALARLVLVIFAAELEDFDSGKVRGAKVDREEAATVDFTGTMTRYGRAPGKTLEIAGRLIVVHLTPERAFILWGFGEPEAWGDFLVTFETMVANVTFFEP